MTTTYKTPYALSNMKIKKYFLGVLLTFLLTNSDLLAQRFNAGVVVGVNASQIDGDRAAGYNKLGLSAGLRATAWLTDKSDLSIDILYSNRGSQSEFNLGSTSVPFKIKLDYIEVPILITYKDWLVGEDDDEYYKVSVSGGLAYSRLFQTTIEDDDPSSPLVQLQDSFRKNDIAIVLGANFNLNQHIGFGFRWTRSFTALYKSGDSNINAPSFVGKFLTFHSYYMF